MDNWQKLGDVTNNIMKNLKHCSSSAQTVPEQCSNSVEASHKHNTNINHNQTGNKYVKNAWN